MCLSGWSQHDVAILDWPVIALQVDRSRRTFVAVDGATGDAGNLLIADDLLAIGDDGDHASDQRDVVGIPLPRRQSGDLAGGDESVDAAEAMRVGLATMVVLDLDFVTPAQIHAAVALLRISKLDVKLEISERPHRAEIDAGARTGEHTAANRPLIG